MNKKRGSNGSESQGFLVSISPILSAMPEQTGHLFLGILMLLGASFAVEIAYEMDEYGEVQEIQLPELNMSQYSDPGKAAMFTDGFFQGDISGGMGIPDSAKDTDEFASIIPNSGSGFWPSGTLYYQFHSSISATNKLLIQSTLSEMTRLTASCVKFVNRNGNAAIRNYVLVRSDTPGCNSAVGRITAGNQPMSLQANGCMWRSTIMHEFMHALGFQHEQSRPDRDSYIRLRLENLEDQKWAFAFDKLTNTNTWRVPYDIRSLMHYGSTGFAKPGTHTITPIGIYANLPLNQIGSRQTLGTNDITLIRRAYKCGY